MGKNKEHDMLQSCGAIKISKGQNFIIIEITFISIESYTTK